MRCRSEARRLNRDPGGAHVRQSRQDSGRTSHIQFVDWAAVVGSLKRRAFMRRRVGAMAVPVVLVLVHEFAAFVGVAAMEDQKMQDFGRLGKDQTQAQQARYEAAQHRTTKALCIKLSNTNILIRDAPLPGGSDERMGALSLSGSVQVTPIGWPHRVVDADFFDFREQPLTPFSVNSIGIGTDPRGRFLYVGNSGSATFRSFPLISLLAISPRSKRSRLVQEPRP